VTLNRMPHKKLAKKPTERTDYHSKTTRCISHHCEEHSLNYVDAGTATTASKTTSSENVAEFCGQSTSAAERLLAF